MKRQKNFPLDKSVGESNEMRKGARQSEALGNVGFWRLLEEARDVRVPPFIKNILSLANLDNPLTLRRVDGQTLNELETFAREAMRELVEDEDLEPFYGRFHKKPDKFRFLVGDRYLVEELASFVRAKPDEFWQGCGGTGELSASATESPESSSAAGGSDRESPAPVAEQSQSNGRAGLCNSSGARRRTEFLRGLREAALGPGAKGRGPERRRLGAGAAGREPRRTYYGNSLPGRFFQRNVKK